MTRCLVTTWPLRPQAAQQLRRGLQADWLHQSSSTPYARSTFWERQEARSLVMVQGLSVSIASGHSFSPPPSPRWRAWHWLTPWLAWWTPRLVALTDAIDWWVRADRSTHVAQQHGLAPHLPACLQPAFQYHPAKVWDTLAVRHQLTPALTAPPQQVLEVGGGTGLLSYALAEEFPHARVLDCDLPATLAVSAALWSSWQGTCGTFPHDPWPATGVVYCVPQQLATLPAASCDLIVCIHALMEMPLPTIAAYFRLWHRLLRAGGWVYVQAFAVSRQDPTVRFETYPWSLLHAATVWDGVPAFAQAYHAQRGEQMRGRLLQRRP